MGSAGTLGDLLASRRRRRFVGRASEIELLRVALDSTEPLFSVLYLHGPAGIGKTRLLDVLAGLAADAGASVVRLDGRDLVPSPPAMLEALSGVFEVPDGDGAIVGPSGSGRVVLLLDTYERLGPLDDWMRTRLLPRLPATALTVVAGRTPPGSAWRADPAWRELLRVVSLRNLSPAESRQYLRACGVDPAHHDRLVEVAHGHPLGLSLLADVVARGGEAVADPLTPDLVGTLLRRFVEVVPSGLHRRALEVCAVARVTTEALLREVLALEDAYELFGWLRELSFVESGPDGVFPHDLARDALEADLRWRDPEGYKRVYRGVRAHVQGRLRSAQGPEQQRAIFDAKFLFRRLPSIMSPVDWEAWGQQYPEPARPEDREPILELVRAWEGAASAAIAARWWERQPEGFFVVRGQDGTVSGFLALLDLTRASGRGPRGRPRRPGRLGLRAAAGSAPARRGGHPDPVRHRPGRLPGPLGDPQRHPDPDHAALSGHPEPGLGLPHPGRAGAMGRLLRGRRPAPRGRRRLRGRRPPVRPVRPRLPSGPDGRPARAGDRTRARPGPAPSPPTGRRRCWCSPSRSSTRPSARRCATCAGPTCWRATRCCGPGWCGTAPGIEEPGAAVLEALVRAAVETLREHPRDDKLWRAVERTYVRPATTQERAAAALGLPFSTYRRHLTQGVDRIVSWLWDQEVYGRASPSSTEHNRAASGLGTGNLVGSASSQRGGGCDDQSDRRPRGGARRQHGRAARRQGAGRCVRAGDGDRPGRAARDTDAPAWRPPRPPRPRAAGARPAGPGGAVSRAHRRVGRRRGAGRRHAGRRAAVPQRSPAPAGAHRAGRAVRQPTVPGGPRPGPGPGAART